MEENKKILIASGCSFTHQPWSWAYKLKELNEYDLLNVSMPCQGNNIIAQKVLYNVNEQLKTKKSEEIIVGIMWSGIDRHNFFIDNNLRLENVDGWEENPTSIVENRKNWVIINSHWNTPLAKMWYQNFHTYVGAMIETLRNILLVQLYLEKNNIKYFMTTYMDILNKENETTLKHPEVEYLFNMVNFEKFLPINGCHEWVKINCKDKGFNKPDFNGYIGIHPNDYGHEMFTKEIILPFLKNINVR
jgi:hypothetical protein